MPLAAKELQQEQGHALVESVQGLLTLICLKLRFAMKEDVSNPSKNDRVCMFLKNIILGLSRWTAWEGCIGSSVCGEGTKRRERFCQNGPPGDNCDSAILTEDNVICSYTCRKFYTFF